MTKWADIYGRYLNAKVNPWPLDELTLLGKCEDRVTIVPESGSIEMRPTPGEPSGVELHSYASTQYMLQATASFSGNGASPKCHYTASFTIGPYRVEARVWQNRCYWKAFEGSQLLKEYAIDDWDNGLAVVNIIRHGQQLIILMGHAAQLLTMQTLETPMPIIGLRAHANTYCEGSSVTFSDLSFLNL